MSEVIARVEAVIGLVGLSFVAKLLSWTRHEASNSRAVAHKS